MKKFSNKSGSPYMILVSKKNFRALGTNLDPEIRIFRKSGNLDFRIWMNQEGSVFFFIIKTLYGLQLLLLTHFDLALPSRGYSTDPS